MEQSWIDGGMPVRNNAIWTDDEIAFLIKTHVTHTAAAQAVHVGRTPEAVRTKRAELIRTGRLERARRTYTEAEYRFLSETDGTRTLTEQAAALGRTVDSVKAMRQHLLRTGHVTRLRRSRHCPILQEVAEIADDFAAMYCEEWPRILRWILDAGMDFDVAEDICTQVFDIALRKGNWHDREEWAARGYPYYKWLTKVAYYKVDDWRRSLHRRPRPLYDPDDNDGDGPDQDRDPALIDPHTEAVFDCIENAMTYAFIKAALPKLPKHQQEAISLHFGVGLSTKAAAARLRMEIAVYRRLLQQALARLSAVMAAQGWDSDGEA